MIHALHYWQAAQTALDHLPLFDPGDPTPKPEKIAPTVFNFDRIKGLLTYGVAPVLGVLIGLFIMALANTGQMSRVTKIAIIAIIGLGFVGGATILMAIGEPAMRAVFGG